MTTTLRVDEERLWRSLSDLGEIGAFRDEDTGLNGVRRLALTDEDAQGRQLVMRWMDEAGLSVRMDQIGNVYARRPGDGEDLPPVMIGSHIDSVATAGRFDGCLGVLGGLEVVRTLDDAGISTRRPIEVAFFTEEEGVRFGTDMLGSAVAVGRIALDDALGQTDRDGVSVGAELDRLGLAGSVAVPIEPPHAYLECHIEQGPILATGEYEVGVVQGVQAITWKELEIRGRAAHAGTTPDELRHNALVAAAMITVHLQEMVDSGHYGTLLTTVGRLDVHPNLINIVPSRVLMTVDLRNHHADQMAAAEAELHRYIDEVAERIGVTITSRDTAKTPPVAFPAMMRDHVAKSAADLGLRAMDIPSGAGHDAGEIAALCPAGMVFVPGMYDGISHNPREYSTPRACADGVNVLLQTVLRLADEP